MAIGERLREARMRQRVDVSEVERVTKIRAKYLRALENEEFDLLPGPTFVKSFLRTYSEYLGLDARALIEEYRDRHEPRAVEEEEPAPFAARPPRRTPRYESLGRPGVGWLAAGAVVGLLALFLIIGLLSGDDEGGSAAERGSDKASEGRLDRSRRRGTGGGAGERRRSVTLRIAPSGPTYVCLDKGPGTDTLFEGSISSPRSWRGRRLRLNLGRPSAVVRANGRRVATGEGANPVGFAFSPNRRPRPLPVGQRPCA